MECEYKRDPQCITAFIDCLGRNGGDDYLNEAEDLYVTYIENNENIYYKFKLPALISLLSSCRIHNDEKRGQQIFDKINMILDEEDCNDNNIITPVYVMLSNVYGQNGKFDKVKEIRQIMKEKVK